MINYNLVIYRDHLLKKNHNINLLCKKAHKKKFKKKEKKMQ